VSGEQDGMATPCLVFAKKQIVSLPLIQYAPEGDMNFLHQNAMPDEQGSPSIYLGGGFHRISLSILGHTNRRPDW